MASRRLLAGFLPLALGAVFAAAPANAVPIVGGTTSVTLTSAPTLGSLGLTVTPTGTASVTSGGTTPTVAFPITGGTQNDSTGALLLQHDGSGLRFSSSTSSNTLTIGNFIVDTAALLVRGNATAMVGSTTTNFGTVDLFNIVAGSPTTLTLTQTSAGALNSVFNTTLAANTTVGTVSINARAAVPEPGTWMMMLLGFGAVGITLRRRNRQLAAA